MNRGSAERAKKKVLIVGASGQAGPYLAKFLVERGHNVVCSSRYPMPQGLRGITALGLQNLVEKIVLDPTDPSAVQNVLEKFEPEYVFHFAGAPSPGRSSRQPYNALDFAIGTLNFLETQRRRKNKMILRVASSGEVFGDSTGLSINELTKIAPRNPYGIEKQTALSLVENYRKTDEVNAAVLHLFNHESPIRASDFVSMKIVRAAIEIAKGNASKLTLGNINVERDWGWAEEYMEAMWMSATDNRDPVDYVVATGTSISLRAFVCEVFAGVDLDWEDHVVYDPDLVRTGEPASIRVDPSKIGSELGWYASTVGLEVPKRLVRLCVENGV